ncbi:IclR family transcriptional regulator [Alkalicoccus halolimnae]|uniref:IclR family transcriptional regulator n=1 Tax=Alkalicoccus halolimnae TaxID=1667239 RepID=A0A5C7FDF5_9BACI|nr:IclR family transcriptional regulator [Alkalicoccus halolimnae]TXF85327.1 IclR family transcriptional regulator [Alkalicoccus halolimnae]
MSGNTTTSSTVLKAIQLLNYLNESQGPKGVNDISNALGFSTTIVHRLLSTLKMENMVFQDPQTKKYSLGTLFLDYANKILTDLPVASVIEPVLEELREITGETVGFYVPKGPVRICAIEIESKQEIRRSVGIGKRLPLYKGATGRAILAFMSKGRKEQIIKNLPENEREEVEWRLSLTKQTGYALNEEEINKNVAALSAPVFDRQQRVIGAVSISGPMFRWNKDTMTAHIPKLLEVTKQITKDM